MAKFGCLVALVTLLVSNVALEQLPSKCMAISDSSGISCGTVTPQLVPCLTFITNKAPTPSSTCCSGAKMVAKMAETVAERRAVCVCIKNALVNMVNINYDHISAIPKDCNLTVTLPPIRNTTDCSTVGMANLFA